MTVKPDEKIETAIRLTREAGTTVVVLNGEIDAALREDAGQVMVQVLSDLGDVIVDASKVAFIDSAGMAFVLQLNRAVSEAGFRCELRNPSETFLELVDMVGMRDRITIS